MNRIIIHAAILICAFLGLSNYAVADTLHYHNLKYGTEVTFPMHLFTKRLEAPLDGSGMSWRGEDGASLSIYTRANALVQTMEEFADQVANNANKTGKVHNFISDNMVIVSGTEKNMLIHMQYKFDNHDTIHGLLIKYPIKAREKYEEYLDDISNSFGFGPTP